MKNSFENLNQDRNFDTRQEKFSRKIYGGLKGDIRLAVLKKDLSEFCNAFFSRPDHTPLNILDAGSGYGPFSIHPAALGHKITLCDISVQMLEKAKIEFNKNNVDTQTDFFNCSIQQLGETHKNKYDLILCHAVLEWVHEPENIISCLLEYLKPGGLLSLTFYNLNGMIFKNLLRTNYKKIINEKYTGWPGSLTPTHPLLPEQVLLWLKDFDLKILCHSGIRVFHDYILDIEDQKKSRETMIDLEIKFSRTMPFRDMGRYQHILCQKPDIDREHDETVD